MSGADASSSGQAAAEPVQVKGGKANVHQYYDRIEIQHPKTKKWVQGSECKECKANFAHKIPTNLKSHLAAKHPDLYEELQGSNANDSTVMKRKVVQEAGTPASDLILGQTSSKKRKKGADKKTLDNDLISEALAYWISASTIPLSVVEDPNFQHFVKMLNDEYKVPSRRTLGNLIADTADKVVAEIKESLSRSRRVAVTTDNWSGKGSKDNFMCCTTQHQDPKTKERKTHRIALRQCNERHTASNLAKKLTSILREYGILEKCWLMTTDSARNMEKLGRIINDQPMKEVEMDVELENLPDEEIEELLSALESFDEEEEAIIELGEMEEEEQESENLVRRLGIRRIPCTSHKIHLVCLRTTKSKLLLFAGPLQKARKFALKYRASGLAKSTLLQWFPLIIPGWVKTRWWSDIQMVDRLVKCAKAPGNPLEKLLDAMDWNISFSMSEIRELDKLLLILKPLERLFSALNSDTTSTIQKVIPSIQAMQKTLGKFIANPDDSCYQFALELSKDLTSTFAYMLDPKHKEFCPEFMVATFFSPEFRFVITPDQVKNVVKKFLEAKVTVPEGAARKKRTAIKVRLPGFEDLQEEFSSSLVGVSNGRGSALTQDIALYEKRASSYIDAYVREAEVVVAEDDNANTEDAAPVDLVIGDPLQFWVRQDLSKEYKTDLPCLISDLLCAPCTSTSSERMFSVSGYLSQNRSSNISPRNLERRCIVKTNRFI